jgi:chemotaxis protein MotB
MAANKPTHQKKEPEAEEHENSERWLLTYADMITLLVAFFIMMYAMSVVNLKKFHDVAISIRSGFGGPFGGNRGKMIIERKSYAQLMRKGSSSGNPSKPSVDQSRGQGNEEWNPETKLNMTMLDYVADQLAVLKLDETMQPILEIDSSDGNKLSVIISDQLFFEPNSAALTDENRKKIDHIADVLRDSPFRISVEGYSSPLHDTSKYHDSWELSTERAREVIQYLSGQTKINPRRLSLTGFGEWRSPGKSRRLGMTAKGEWKTLSDRSEKDDDADRVVISVVLK